MQHGRTSGFYQGKPTGAIADYYEYRRLFPTRRGSKLGKKRNVAEIFTGDEGWEVTYRGKRALPADQVQDFVRRRDHSIEAAVRVWLKDPKTILIYGGQRPRGAALGGSGDLDQRRKRLDHDRNGCANPLAAAPQLAVARPLYTRTRTPMARSMTTITWWTEFPRPFDVSRYHNGDLTNQRFLYDAATTPHLPPDIFDPDKPRRKIEK